MLVIASLMVHMKGQQEEEGVGQGVVIRVDGPPGLRFKDEASFLQLMQVAEECGLRDTAYSRENGRGCRSVFLQEPKKNEASRVCESGQAEEHLRVGLSFLQQALPDAIQNRGGDGHEGIRLRGVVHPAALTGRLKKSAGLKGAEAQAGLILRETDGSGNLADRFAGVRQDGFQTG